MPDAESQRIVTECGDPSTGVATLAKARCFRSTPAVISPLGSALAYRQDS